MPVIRVVFVCHGNICRSPMAEYIMKYLLSGDKLKDAIEVSSAGVSDEECGNDIYPPAKRMLSMHNIPYGIHYAHRITDPEFDAADYIFVMDHSNLAALKRRFGNASGKIRMLIDKDVDDPWYTGDFASVFNEIFIGCSEILKKFHENG